MSKSLADAVITARQFTTQKEKFAALSGLGAVEQKLLFETFNPYRVFGVRQFDMPTRFPNGDYPSYTPFLHLLDLLATRVLTGNAAKEAVTRTLCLYTQRTAEVLAQVILKDLNCGANRDTFEKLYPNLGIPKFDQMLCAKIEHAKNKRGEIIYPKYQWVFPCLGEVKYDGFRLIAMVKNGVVEYISRGGKPADQWQGLFDDELIEMEKYCGKPIVVDGEILSPDSIQGTAKAKGSKNDKSAMKFFAFDMMTLADWEAQRCMVPQLQRTSGLESLIKHLALIKVIKSKAKVLNNLQEAEAFYTEVIELGLPGQDEGLIIKQLNGLYEWTDKRTMTWAKWKPVIDVDVKIVGCYEGAGKNVGRLGGFYVEGEDENRNKIKSRCGGFKVNSAKFKAWVAKFTKVNHIALDVIYASGVSKDEFFRTYAWSHQEKFVGQTCVIETQNLSLAEGSDTFALRFPQFISLRTDK